MEALCFVYCLIFNVYHRTQHITVLIKEDRRENRMRMLDMSHLAPIHGISRGIEKEP